MTGRIRLAMLFGASLALFCTAGCAGRPRADAENVIAFGEDEAMRTMDTPVSIAEFMLYSIDVKTAYDEAMGAGFYERVGTNAFGIAETYEDIVKEEIAESVRMVRVLCAAAEPEYGITMSLEEERIVKENAGAYYVQMAEAGVDKNFLTEETVQRFIREEYLAGKVYAFLADRYTERDAATVDVGNGLLQEDEQNISLDTEALAGAIAELTMRYDGDYSYITNINWELMDDFSLQRS